MIILQQYVTVNSRVTQEYSILYQQEMAGFPRGLSLFSCENNIGCANS